MEAKGWSRGVESHFAKWDLLYVTVGAVLTLLVGIVFFLGLTPWVDKPEPGVQAAIASADAAFIVGLFAVMSAFHARRQVGISNQAMQVANRQAEISNRAVEVALNAELNSAAPVVKLEAKEAGHAGARFIEVKYTNIGKGPALNFQCWIDHEELPNLQSLSRRKDATAVGVGESSKFTWSCDDSELPQLRNGGDISAQYDDIFGRVFESKLQFVSNGPPLLAYGKADEEKGGDRRRYY